MARPQSLPQSSIPGEVLSTSQLNVLNKCGQRYVFRYIEKIPEPGSLARAKGTGVHSAGQANFQQKIDSDADIPPEDFVSLAVESFDAEVKGSLQFTREEEGIGLRRATGRQRDHTARLAGVFHSEVSPSYHPIAVEQPFAIPLPSANTTFVGVVDLVDVVNRIIDHKTGKRHKTQADVDTSLQLTSYAAAQTRAGRPPGGVLLESLAQNKAGDVTRRTLKTTRGAEDYAALAARIAAAKRQIDAGAFGPAPEGAWWCSPSWCGYWAMCPFVNRSKATSEE